MYVHVYIQLYIMYKHTYAHIYVHIYHVHLYVIVKSLPPVLYRKESTRYETEMIYIVQGEAECYISIEAKCRVLYFMYSTWQGNDFKCYKEFPLHSLITIKHTKFANSDNKLHRIRTELDFSNTLLCLFQC